MTFHDCGNPELSQIRRVWIACNLSYLNVIFDRFAFSYVLLCMTFCMQVAAESNNLYRNMHVMHATRTYFHK